MEHKGIDILDIILAKAMVGDAAAAAARAKEYAEAAQEYAESIDPETLVRIADLPDITVGMADNAKQLVATVGINDNAPYLFRTSGGTADIGDRETDEIVGVSVPWNQLISTNRITVPEGTYVWAHNSQFFNGITNHRYLMTCDNPELVIRMRNQNEGYVSPNGQNIIVSPSFTGTNIVQYNGTSTKDSHINVHDLTIDFGSAIADYAYALEQATAGSGIAWLRKYGFFTKPYYPYNAGGLLSVKTSAHKMVGFNAWDEQTELGAINQNGELVNSTTTLRSKNYTRVCSGTTYYMSVPAAIMNWSAGYNANYELVGGLDIRSNQTFTIPDDVCYVKFSFLSSYGTTYKNDICFNLSWDGERDGEYAPYVEYNYPLDSDLELRGIAKLDSNNNLYYDGDTYASDGTVTRKWDVVVFNADTPTSELGFSAGDSVNRIVWNPYALVGIVPDRFISDKLESVPNLSGMPTKAWTIYSSTTAARMWIGVPTTITSVADFITYVTTNPITVIYPLATPSTESADPYTNPQIVDDFGTEEYIDEREVTIPVGHNTVYSANLRAKLEMAPGSPDGDGDYIVRQTNGTNEYVPLPVTSFYQHNLDILLSGDFSTTHVYMSYVSNSATPITLVSIGTTGNPVTGKPYSATAVAIVNPIGAITFGTLPDATLTYLDGTTVSVEIASITDNVG